MPIANKQYGDVRTLASLASLQRSNQSINQTSIAPISTAKPGSVAQLPTLLFRATAVIKAKTAKTSMEIHCKVY